MGKLVVLKLGEGNFEQGFPVTIEIGDECALASTVTSGSLPPFPQMPEHYHNWQASYRQNWWHFRELKHKKNQLKNISILQDCISNGDILVNSLNVWLDSPEFCNVKESLLKYLQPLEEIRFLIQTNNLQLRRLPWHLWRLILKDYPKAEITFIPPEYEPLKQVQAQPNKEQVRILVILGDSTDIKVEKDLELLQQRLPDAYILPLINPQRDELSDRLWEQAWDILFFAGHSSSSSVGNGQGSFNINETESIAVADLKQALMKAIAGGLKLAIFNSCDGLGLAQDLQELQLTASIVMRERIPDEAAQKFLEYFLKAFAEQGKSLYIAVREARQRLHSLENKYPCASWLPVICEHSPAPRLTWQKLGGSPPCPYRGLSAFSPDDAPFFFGREGFTNQLVEAVNKKPLVAVIGASGSGKSSVVFAGLIPRLQQATPSEFPLVIAAFRPGKNPFEALATALISVHKTSISDDEKKLAELELGIELQQNIYTLYNKIESIVQQGNGNHLLLVIDQFEELYTLCPEIEHQIFLDGLLTAVNQSPGFTLVLTLRADFFGRILMHESFGKVLQQYPPELLIPMNRKELQAAIAKPSEKLGIQLEQGLTERLIDAVSKQPGHLPLLEFALTQLWAKQKQGILSHAAYEEICGVEKALANHAKRVYIQLNQADRERSQKIFIQLVHPGEGTEDTRRLATRTETGEDNWDLITYLASERLVVTNRNTKTGEETVEIVHEALIQNWKELYQWIQKNRDFRSWQERLRTAIYQWETKHNCDQGALLRGAPLEEAKDWLQQQSDKISSDERQFIDKSIELQKREQAERDRQQQRTILILVSGLVTTSLLAALAVQQWQLAESQKTNSQIKAINADAETLWLSDKKFDALIESLKAANKLQQVRGIEPELRIQVAATLQQALYSVRERNRLEKHSDRIRSVSFSPDGQTIASASFDKTVSWDYTVKLWNLKGDLLQILKGHTDQVDSISFSSDSQLIATASADKTIKIWKYDSKKRAYNSYKTLRGHKDTIYSVTFSPNGQMIASASKDGTIKIWSREGVLLETFQGHTNSVNSLSFSPDGQTIVSGSADSTVRFWTLSRSNIFKGHRGAVDDVTFSRDGQQIATAGIDGTVRVWNLLGKQLIKFKDKANNVSFSPDGKIIATASEDNTVKLWSRNGILLRSFKGHTGKVFDVSFSPDSQLIASASVDKTVKVWKVDGSLLHTLKGHGGKIWSVSFSPDGQTIATASSDRTVKLWNLNGTLKQNLQGHNDDVLSVSFSPDGQTIATASQDNTVKLWKFDGTLLHTLTGHTDTVNSISFSPDGQTIASASDDTTIKLWSLEGRLLKTFQGHSQRVNSVSFSPNAQLIASAGSDGDVILWSLDLDFLSKSACDWVRDYLKNSRNGERTSAICII